MMQDPAITTRTDAALFELIEQGRSTERMRQVGALYRDALEFIAKVAAAADDEKERGTAIWIREQMDLLGAARMMREATV